MRKETVLSELPPDGQIPVAEAIEVADEVVDAAPKSAEVALLDPLRDLELALAGLKEEGEKATWDVDTADGEKAAREFRAKCVKVRTSADAAYEQGNKPLLNAQRQARDIVKKIKDTVQPVEDAWDAKIKAKEDRKAREKAERERIERERIAAIRARIGAITTSPVNATALKAAADVALVMKELNDLPITEDLFGEFVEEASAARERALSAIGQMHQAAVARELEEQRLEQQRQELARQQEELERLRREQQARLDEQRRAEEERLAAERRAQEERAAAERAEIERQAAEERARIDAERAEQERILAEQRAEQERQAAELKTQQDAFEAEKRAARERLEAEERAREEQRQADLKAIEDAKKPDGADDESTMPGNDGAIDVALSAPGAAEAAAEVVAPQLVVDNAAPAQIDRAVAPGSTFRPTDEAILATLASAFAVSEDVALGWIDDFDVGAQMLRLEEAA